MEKAIISLALTIGILSAVINTSFSSEAKAEEDHMVNMCEIYFNEGPSAIKLGGALPDRWKKNIFHKDCMKLKKYGDLKINADSWILIES